MINNQWNEQTNSNSFPHLNCWYQDNESKSSYCFQAIKQHDDDDDKLSSWLTTNYYYDYCCFSFADLTHPKPSS